MSSTRLLVLGVVRIFQPVHGYDVHRELLSGRSSTGRTWRPGPDWTGVAASVALVALLGALMASVSYALGLALKSEDALAPLLNGVSIPLLLLSGILLPMSLVPTWLYNLSRANPLAYMVDAARDLFAGELATRAVAVGFTVTLAYAVLAAIAAVRTFQRESG